LFSQNITDNYKPNEVPHHCRVATDAASMRLTPTLRRVFIHYIHTGVCITSRQLSVVMQAPVCGKTSERHMGPESHECLGLRIGLCVGNLPMAEAPHQNLHIGTVREFHLIMTFEFSVRRENLVVKWLFFAIPNTRVWVTQKACCLKCCAASNWY